MYYCNKARIFLYVKFMGIFFSDLGLGWGGDEKKAL